MEKHHYTALFIAGIILIFSMSMIMGTRKIISANDTEERYSSMLVNACVDGMKEVTPGYKNVFDTKIKRNKCIAGFYESLMRGLQMNTGVGEEAVYEKTPFVLLIDHDGFYISYNAVFDEYITSFRDDTGAELSPEEAHMAAMTELNVWSEDYNGYVVRFYLSDYCQIVTPSNTVHEGTREEMKAKFSTLDFLQTKEKFEIEKRYVIIQKLEDQINFLLNSQPINEDKYYKAYTVTLPQKTMEDWSRMLSRPCLISFLQGDTTTANSKTMSIFAFAGSEVIKPALFYKNGNLYYKQKIGTEDSYGTMYDCAEKGATPDISAMWDN